MNKTQPGTLSKSERQEIDKAQQQIAQAQRHIADVVLRHLNKTPEDEEISVEISRGITVIRCGGKVCGIYADPPGVCVAVN